MHSAQPHPPISKPPKPEKYEFHVPGPSYRRPVQPVIWINGWPSMGKLALAQCLMTMIGEDQALIIDDREFVDMRHLPRDVLMARHASRDGSRPRGLSVTDSNGDTHLSVTDPINKTHTHRYNICGNPNETGMCPGIECPGRGCPGLEVLGGRLVTGLEGLAQPLREKQEDCFRKYVHGNEDKTSGPDDKDSLSQRQRVVIFTDSRANDANGAEGANRYEEAAREAGREFIPVYLKCMPEEHARRAKQLNRLYLEADGTAKTGIEATRKLQSLSEGRLFTFSQEKALGLFINGTKQPIPTSALEIIKFMQYIMGKQVGHARDQMIWSIDKRPVIPYVPYVEESNYTAETRLAGENKPAEEKPKPTEWPEPTKEYELADGLDLI